MNSEDRQLVVPGIDDRDTVVTVAKRLQASLAASRIHGDTVPSERNRDGNLSGTRLNGGETLSREFSVHNVETMAAMPTCRYCLSSAIRTNPAKSPDTVNRLLRLVEHMCAAVPTVEHVIPGLERCVYTSGLCRFGIATAVVVQRFGRADLHEHGRQTLKSPWAANW